MELLDIGAEGLGLFEDPLALRRSGFRELIDVDGDFPSMLGMMVRSSPAPVIARIWDWSSISVSTSTGETGIRRRCRRRRSARPLTVCEQPAASTTAAHQTTKRSGRYRHGVDPSRIESNRDRILFTE